MVAKHSVLDNDFYKFTMQQGVIELFPAARARYSFINRGKHQFPDGFAQALRQATHEMALLQLSREEKMFLQLNCPFLTPLYLDVLQAYRYNPDEVIIEQNGGELSVYIEGLWYRTILWEIPLMSLICELYYKLTHAGRMADSAVISSTAQKIRKYCDLGITVAEFGTRRRHSYDVHSQVVAALKEHGEGCFIGSSNVHMAMKYHIKPIGTHAHEWFMFHAANYGFKMANAMALENWVRVYRGDLGIALSDTYTTEVFFRQFDKMYSKLFDGVRHDSGDPLRFVDTVVDHYERLGIDPLSKTIIFSDSLNYEKVERIAKYCRGKVGASFGIGTSFTNDVGPKALNIVIKMTGAQTHDGEWTEVVKLSDEQGKYTGSERMIALAREILEI